jgi:hypothetical protein
MGGYFVLCMYYLNHKSLTSSTVKTRLCFIEKLCRFIQLIAYKWITQYSSGMA